MRSVAGFLGRTLSWLIIFAAIAVITAAVLVPRATGSTPYTIITGSMAPLYPPGTLVVVRPVDPAELSVGDVVTIQLESGKETVVTHRITEIQYRTDGQLQFITKGDANPVADAEPRLAVQIRGKVWYAVGYLGYVSTAVPGAQRGLAVSVIAVLLLVYGFWMFVSALRDKRAPKPRRALPRRATAQVPARAFAEPHRGLFT